MPFDQIGQLAEKLAVNFKSDHQTDVGVIRVEEMPPLVYDPNACMIVASRAVDLDKQPLQNKYQQNGIQQVLTESLQSLPAAKKREVKKQAAQLKHKTQNKKSLMQRSQFSAPMHYLKQRENEKRDKDSIVLESTKNQGSKDEMNRAGLESLKSSAAQLSEVHVQNTVQIKGLSGMLINGNIDYTGEAHRLRHAESMLKEWKRLQKEGTVGGKHAQNPNVK